MVSYDIAPESKKIYKIIFYLGTWPIILSGCNKSIPWPLVYDSCFTIATQVKKKLTLAETELGV